MNHFCHIYEENFVPTINAPPTYVSCQCAPPSVEEESELVPSPIANDGLTPRYKHMLMGVCFVQIVGQIVKDANSIRKLLQILDIKKMH